MFWIEVDEEILLKLIEPKEAERMLSLAEKSKPALREWLPWLDSTATIKDMQTHIDFCTESYHAAASLNAVILYEGEIVGMAGYTHIDWANSTVSIGYWLGSCYEGKGIVTRAVRALMDYAFTDMKINRIEIRAASGNEKSRAVPARLGFKIEGTLRQAEWLYDHYVDHIMYGMLASEWESR